MKALLDEQLSPRITELLRSRGCDVQAVVDRRDLAGQSDRVILEAAAVESRAVITSNVNDFRPLAAERLARGESHAGLILLPSTRTRTRDAIEMVADAIEHLLLLEHPDGLPATERWVPPASNL
jgi:predicted nuclease of predicted toxin-antitoxin system